MKKKIVVLLSVVLVMCTLLCACGNNVNPKVKADLLGEWIYPATQGDGMSVVIFDEDIATTYTIYDSITTEPMEKEYSIKDDTIVVKQDGSDWIISYSYEDGELKLFTKTGTELVKFTGSDEESETTTGITEEDIEEVAMQKVYSIIKSEYQFHCNPEKTTYSIGTIKQTDDDEYNVKGTLTLYDDYGNLAYLATFEVDVEGDSSANLKAGYPDIELD